MNADGYTALCDANVLYSAPLRDLLLWMAAGGLFLPRWTDRIHDEWTRNLLANRPDLRPDAIRRTREQMDISVPDCLVVGYEHRIATLDLPDADDRHVLAAAIETRADAIITFNLADFPVDRLAPFDIEPLHPDEFVSRRFDADQAGVCTAVRRQRQGMLRPPKTPDELLDTLAAQSLPKTVARLRPFINVL